MFITPAYAQSGGGSPDFLMSILPFVMIFVIMYFLIIRPQQKRMREHREMVANVRRGDTVVTSGGLIGKVLKVDDQELQLEIATGVKVRVMRQTLSEVRGKGQPVEAAAKS
ncbi:MAG: preprotein translocase subunit YajC [Hyphomicrobiales bacterium]